MRLFYKGIVFGGNGYRIVGMVLLCLFVYLTMSHEILAHGGGQPQSKGGQFIENQGQWKGPFRFKSAIGNVDLFISPQSITYHIDEPVPHGPSQQDTNGYRHRGHSYRVSFVGSSERVALRGQDVLKTYHNYFLGSDTTRWRSRVPLYSGMIYEGLYEGIDLKMYFDGGVLKYDYIVAPGADPSLIVSKYEGQDGICLTALGHLELNTTMGTIHEMKPYAYQIIDGREVEVACAFHLQGETLTYRLTDEYDRSRPLIIDPVLIFSTFSGSTGDNFGVTATYDEAGNAYAAGLQYSSGYPTTVGAYDRTYGPLQDSMRQTDMAITKFSSDGQNQIYSTYLGGNKTDMPHSIVVNQRDELVVLGTTNSTDFPTTAGAYDRGHNGGQTVLGGFGQDGTFTVLALIDEQGLDICITTFSADGGSLVGSTYVGGSGNDGLSLSGDLTPNYGDEIRGEVITDDNNDIFIVSITESNDFPTTAGSFQANFAGGRSDAVVMRFNRTLTTLSWSSYFGGGGDESATSLELDLNNNVYFTGGTTSNNLPVGGAGLNTTYRGGRSDGYAAVLSADGGQRIAGTYVGTEDADLSYFVDIDLNGDVYLLGNNYSGSYPVTADVYSNPSGLQFIHKLDPQLSTTQFSTVFGAAREGSYLALNAFLIDECFRIYVSGWGGATNQLINPQTFSIAGFPTTPDAIRPNTDGSDFYLMVLDPNAVDLEYGSYFGGDSELSSEHVDGGTSRFDDRGVIYQAVCAGCGGTSDFPTTPGAWSNTNNSENCNLALVKLDFQLDEIIAQGIVAPEPIGCAPFTVDFENLSLGPIDSFFWDFGDGTFSNLRAPSKVYDVPGTYEVTLVAVSAFDCKPPDTAVVEVIVNEVFNENQVDSTLCPDVTGRLEASHDSPNALYRWSTGEETSGIDVSQPGRYIVVVKDPDACYVDTFDIDFYPDRDTLINQRFCEITDRSVLRAPLDNATYQWDDGGTNRLRNIAQPGRYTVVQVDENDCEQTAEFNAIDVDTILENTTPISLCELRNVTIGASHQDPSFTYIWNDGVTTPNIDIDAPGTYVVVTYPPFDSSCAFTDSFIVVTDVEPGPLTVELGICRLQELTLTPPPPIFNNPTYTWIPPSSSPSITIDRQGTYELTITYPFECDREYVFDVDSLPSFELSSFYFPNAFSPNNDGINDVFLPLYEDGVPILEYHLQIFDRWGGLVFESLDPEIGWNGVTATEDAGIFGFVWQCDLLIDACIEGETARRRLEGEVFIIR